MKICREFHPTKLSLDRFRELLSVDPIPFWSASLEICGFDWGDTACRDEWQRYNWQRPNALNHQDLTEAIKQAEDEITRQVGYPVGPEWICERHPTVTHQGNRAGAYKINKPWVTAFGSRNSQMLAEVSLTETYETTQIQPFNAVFHSEYQMTWNTPEHCVWRISINGTEYDISPTGLNINPRRADLQRWLNTLGLGFWYVNIQDPLQPFLNSDYDGAPIPTIEAPDGATIDYIITYSHAEANRYRISWDFDGHVINGVWIDTPGLGLTDTFAIDVWADGLGLGNWGVFGSLGGDITLDPPILLIPDKPTVFEVYGSRDVTALEVLYADKLVIAGTYYDNTAIAGNDAAIQAFLQGVGLDLGYQQFYPYAKIILNPTLIIIHYVYAATLQPQKLFGLIKDEDIFGPTLRPFAYTLEESADMGAGIPRFMEKAVIIGDSLEPQMECEIRVYAVGDKRYGQPDELCRVRPLHHITLNTTNGEFSLEIPTHLLIKNEYLDQRINRFSDPFPIQLCCASDDLVCDNTLFYIDHLEVWRIWHDNTQPAAIFRGGCNCSSEEPCRVDDLTACANVTTMATQFVTPFFSSYHTINIPDTEARPEHDAWQGRTSCFNTTACAVDFHYYFDPCDENCKEIGCNGDICHKFERAVFMLACARLADLCACGCENGRVKTFQREAGSTSGANNYNAQTVFVSSGKIGSTREYPFGTRYGEVEAWRIVRQYVLKSGGSVWGGVL
jgi:hypothetical protein